MVGGGDARGIASESSAALAGALGVVVGGDAPGIANGSSAALAGGIGVVAGAIGVVVGGGDAPGIANGSSAALAGWLGLAGGGGDAPGIANESSALGDRLGLTGGAVSGSAHGSRNVAAGRDDGVAPGRRAGFTFGVSVIDRRVSVDDRGASVIGIGRSSPTIPPTSGPDRGISRCAGVVFGIGGVTGRGAGAALRADLAAGLFGSKRGGSVGFLT